jgi:hypothetical protein
MSDWVAFGTLLLASGLERNLVALRAHERSARRLLECQRFNTPEFPMSVRILHPWGFDGEEHSNPPGSYRSDSLNRKELESLKQAVEEWMYYVMLGMGDHEYAKAGTNRGSDKWLEWWMSHDEWVEKHRGSEREGWAKNAVALFGSDPLNELLTFDTGWANRPGMDRDAIAESLESLLGAFGCEYVPYDGHWMAVYCSDPAALSYPKDYRQQLDDERWKKTSRAVRSRAGWRCFDCRQLYKDLAAGEYLEVHHTYYRFPRAAWQYPLESLVAVCGECHRKRDNRHRRMDLRWEVLRTVFRGPEIATIMATLEEVASDPGERFRFRELMNRLRLEPNRRKLGQIISLLEENTALREEW